MDKTWKDLTIEHIKNYNEMNFFNVWMNGFQTERYYKFELKVVTGSASSATQIVNYYDDDFTFKVTR